MLHDFTPGAYQFLRGGFPYSAGVIAQPGWAIQRVRFARPLPVAAGFAAIERHLAAIGRPLTALCAAELRSPSPFSMGGFQDFNRGYVDVLERWGLVRDGLNPVARSNVCPAFDAPPEPSFHAFCFTVPDATHDSGRDFVVAGSGEWPEDQPFPAGIVARGDVSAAGLQGDWQGLTAAQVYTVHDIHPLLRSHFAAQGLTAAGLTWFTCAPPILELEFEMDLRRVRTELVWPAEG